MAKRTKKVRNGKSATTHVSGSSLLAQRLANLRGKVEDDASNLFIDALIGLGDGSLEQPGFLANIRGIDGFARGLDREIKRRELELRAGGRIIDLVPEKKLLAHTMKP